MTAKELFDVGVKLSGFWILIYGIWLITWGAGLTIGYTHDPYGFSTMQYLIEGTLALVLGSIVLKASSWICSTAYGGSIRRG